MSLPTPRSTERYYKAKSTESDETIKGWISLIERYPRAMSFQKYLQSVFQREAKKVDAILYWRTLVEKFLDVESLQTQLWKAYQMDDGHIDASRTYTK